MQDTRFMNPVLAILISAAVAPQLAAADDFDTTWYLGAGAGYTNLDPDTGSNTFTLTDDEDAGYKVFIGYDFSEMFSAEVFYNDLGTANIQSGATAGELDMSAYGANVLWYFWRHDADYGKRKGWQAYVNAGVSSLDTSNNIGLNTEDDTQFNYGIAAEYGWDNGFAVRVGYDGYESDAAMLSVNLVKRFGAAKSQPVMKSEPAPAPVAVAPVAAAPADSDKDGVLDSADKCPGSPSDKPVDADGCTIVSVVLENVVFESGSANLTQASYDSLNKAVAAMNKYPQLRIEIQAYTDSMGEESFNQYLSEQRASSVRSYMIDKGVAADRLEAKGYGEAQPIADNGTREGRAKNRRVELKIID